MLHWSSNWRYHTNYMWQTDSTCIMGNHLLGEASFDQVLAINSVDLCTQGSNFVYKSTEYSEIHCLRILMIDLPG